LAKWLSGEIWWKAGTNLFITWLTWLFYSLNWHQWSTICLSSRYCACDFCHFSARVRFILGFISILIDCYNIFSFHKLPYIKTESGLAVKTSFCKIFYLASQPGSSGPDIKNQIKSVSLDNSQHAVYENFHIFSISFLICFGLSASSIW